jgi:hypothetical protein
MTMPSDADTGAPAGLTPEKLRVLIVGGGVAGLETALALADLAPEYTDVTLIAPNEEFVYRPMVVREPFAYSPAGRYPLAPIVAHSGATLLRGELDGSILVRRRSTRRQMRRSPMTCWSSRLERASTSATSTP